jgi:hypothetical protein
LSYHVLDLKRRREARGEKLACVENRKGVEEFNRCRVYIQKVTQVLHFE